jgi:signal transduction histidine kinase
LTPSRSVVSTRATRIDVGVAVGLLLLALLPLGVPGLDLSELHGAVTGVSLAVLVLLQTLPLLLRRRLPGIVLFAVGTGFAVAQTAGADTGLAGLGVLVALYSCARFVRGSRVRAAVLVLAGYLVLVAVLVVRGSPERPVDWVTFVAVLAVPWCIGLVVRQQVEQQEGREREAAVTAVTEARAALARDLHDVVTHHVTAMVLQAESSVFASEGAPEDDKSIALTAIGSSGRAALTELRSLLDALAPSEPVREDRAPVAVDLDGLVRRLAGTGYPVSMERADAVRLAPAVERVLHDVAREALTNAMKHAPGVPVRCTLQPELSDPVGVTRLVVENALAPHASTSSGSGRGTSIMGRRAEEAGGQLSAGVVNGATYRVVVMVPSGGKEISA